MMPPHPETPFNHLCLSLSLFVVCPTLALYFHYIFLQFSRRVNGIECICPAFFEQYFNIKVLCPPKSPSRSSSFLEERNKCALICSILLESTEAISIYLYLSTSISFHINIHIHLNIHIYLFVYDYIFKYRKNF